MRSESIKTLPFILLALAALSLASCNGTVVGLGAAAAGIYYTRDKAKPPADKSLQIAKHESWCYETLGEPECYSRPQKDRGGQLIMVEPANRYPLTARAYDQAAISEQ